MPAPMFNTQASEERLTNHVEIYIDIMFVDKIPFFILFGLGTLAPLDGNSAKVYEAAVEKVISTYRSNSYVITRCSIDAESALIQIVLFV